MIGRSKTNEDPYYLCEEEEDIVDKSKYLTAVGIFTYLTTHTKPDTIFTTSILAKHSKKPIVKHWNGVKHLMRYLQGTSNLGLYYQKTNNFEIMGFADSADYLTELQVITYMLYLSHKWCSSFLEVC